MTLENAQQQIEKIANEITKDQIIVMDDVSITMDISEIRIIKSLMRAFENIRGACLAYIRCEDIKESKIYEDNLDNVTQKFNLLSEKILTSRILSMQIENDQDFKYKIYLDSTYFDNLINQTLQKKILQKMN